ncbi:benzoate 4-monooxygenase cytochrome P450 [Coccidioides posadasii str. Silveira]|uniref:Benzoate 4-monooxygenase cytochrome P450 n=1 Tax=Coccidioides posadasii (strain RMSCC 757 / Silveira) TaxID=443226 RepID=E9CU21_COCPS|nr:benzoate 4-monooxygenase cytochrome P450 [Coccidioides posadasii str. Silveira]
MKPFVLTEFGFQSHWILLAALYLAGWAVYQGIKTLYWHPLAKFPGPRIGALTRLYKTYVECVAQGSFVHLLEEHHARYGDIVRVGPNELHFSNPATYLEIYNPSNRWDKEESLYHSFGEDRSSFGFLTYKEAKERKDVLNRMLSRKAILGSQGIVQEKVVELCKSFERKKNSTVNLFYAFRCMSIDVITYLCFGSSVDAINAPDHQAPIIIAMDASLPVFVRFKHSAFYKSMIVNCPPAISKIVSPLTAGLVDLQQLLKGQIKEMTEDPSTLEKLPHSRTVFTSCCDQRRTRAGPYHVQTASMKKRKPLCLAAQIQPAQPSCMTAVLKESLRMSPGVASALPRIVPPSGAKISGQFIPGGTVVGMSSHFVHRSETVFEKPNEFIPDRWLGEKGSQLDKWLFSFSHGPRSCLGQNLAWAELYFCFAHLYRKFDIEMDPSSPRELQWRDRFLPEYIGPHLKAKITPVAS